MRAVVVVRSNEWDALVNATFFVHNLYALHEYHGNITGCSCYGFDLNCPEKIGGEGYGLYFPSEDIFIYLRGYNQHSVGCTFNIAYLQSSNERYAEQMRSTQHFKRRERTSKVS
jgi:hypothetical protein